MAKTYNTLGTVAPGDVLRANSGTAAYNGVITNVNNYRVPPTIMARVTSDITGYTAGNAISFTDKLWDTDFGFTSGTTITVGTAGLYLINFHCYYTATATVASSEPRVRAGGAIVARMTIPPVGSTTGYAELTAVVSLTASQTITVEMAFSGGSAYVIKGGTTGSDRTFMSATWIGQVS
jgi:hypothetical protein